MILSYTQGTSYKYRTVNFSINCYKLHTAQNCTKNITITIAGENEFMPKNAKILSKLRLQKMAVMSKNTLKYTIFLTYIKNTL